MSDADRPSGPHPIDGQTVLHAGVLASVSPERLPSLLARVQRRLAGERETYRRQFECVHEDGDRAVYLVPADHWTAVGERVGLGRRETDAVRRAHEQQLLRVGSDAGRREEFENALDIRSAVVVGAAERTGT
ncbi:MAG: hypothetical protein ABEJ85_04395 [Haloarculaceae archaeon]